MRTNLAQMTTILKPSKNRMNFFAYCAEWVKEANESEEEIFEISGLYTKSGNPVCLWK